MESPPKAALNNNLFKRLIDIIYCQIQEDIKLGRPGPKRLTKELLHFLIENDIAKVGLNHNFDPPKIELVIYPK